MFNGPLLHGPDRDLVEQSEKKEKEDIEAREKHPLKKYQMDYNESICLSNKIAEVGIQGKRLEKPEGQVTYELNDEFRVLEGISNTPKMWQHHKAALRVKSDFKWKIV